MGRGSTTCSKAGVGMDSVNNSGPNGNSTPNSAVPAHQEIELLAMSFCDSKNCNQAPEDEVPEIVFC